MSVFGSMQSRSQQISLGLGHVPPSDVHLSAHLPEGLHSWFGFVQSSFVRQATH
jgi:hypothetical protein